MEYARTSLPVCLSVRSITTIFRVDFSTYPRSGGESHYLAELKYIDLGTHSITVDGVPFTLNEGQMMIYAPFSFHDSAESSCARASIVSFETDGEEFDELYNRVITLNSVQRKMISDIVDRGSELFTVADPKTGVVGMVPKAGVDPLELQKLKNQLELFFLDVYQTDKSALSNRRIYRKDQFDALVVYMRSRLCESITLDDIARDCSMSVSKVKLIFSEQCDSSPIAYFISMKLDEAKRLISETPMNFTQISDHLGFTSVHYFSKLFKKKTGMTPSEYSRSLLK